MEAFFLNSAIALGAYMLVWYIVSLIKKNMSIVDLGWGIGFMFLAGLAFAWSPTESFAQVLILCMVWIWGIRLVWHIGARNLGKPEDPRYAAWRKKWTYVKLRSFFQVFVLQGLLLYIIALPILMVNIDSRPAFLPYLYAGVLVWIAGFLFETIGDWQLSEFIKYKKKKGQLMMEGLWSMTRHPNYFGEAVMWWGIWMVSFAATGVYWTVVSPIVITLLLRFVSGVKMTERRWKEKKDFPKYKKKSECVYPVVSEEVSR